MAKVWVEGYTKKSGAKVKGHYRNLDVSYFDRNNIASAARHYRKLSPEKQRAILKDFVKAGKKFSYRGDFRPGSLRERYKAQLFARIYGQTAKRRK